jgi:hypothetical protein
VDDDGAGDDYGRETREECGGRRRIHELNSGDRAHRNVAQRIQLPDSRIIEENDNDSPCGRGPGIAARSICTMSYAFLTLGVASISAAEIRFGFAFVEVWAAAVVEDVPPDAQAVARTAAMARDGRRGLMLLPGNGERFKRVRT